MIPYSTQTIEYDDLEAVRDVLILPFSLGVLKSPNLKTKFVPIQVPTLL